MNDLQNLEEILEVMRSLNIQANGRAWRRLLIRLEMNGESDLVESLMKELEMKHIERLRVTLI